MAREKLVHVHLKTRPWSGFRTALLGVALALGLAGTVVAASVTGAGATDPARLDPPPQGLELDFEGTLRRVKEFRGKRRGEQPVLPAATSETFMDTDLPADTQATSVSASATTGASASSPAALPVTGQSTIQSAKGPVLDKVERDWGLRPFKKNGYQMLVEPRISFIKRKPEYSEVVEYSWQPLIIEKMPHRERIDRVRFSFNRYYFAGRERRIFYGGGLGGNIILFNHELKDWARDNNLSLKDGVNGLGRLFFGYKLRNFTFNKWTYPIVFRVEAIISPAYKFGGNLGRAGDRLELNEISAGLSFGIE